MCWFEPDFTFFYIAYINLPADRGRCAMLRFSLSAIGPISRFLKNHEEGIIKHININHTLSYDIITLNLFHI